MSDDQTQFNEAPLQSMTDAPKPIVEMNDLELAEWHAKLRNVTQNHQSFMAHVRGLKTKKDEQPGEYV